MMTNWQIAISNDAVAAHADVEDFMLTRVQSKVPRSTDSDSEGC